MTPETDDGPAPPAGEAVTSSALASSALASSALASSTVWRVSRRSGTAVELHALVPSADDGRTMFVMDVAGPAVVFGSTQSGALADESVAVAAGVEIASRRSGGGAVWLAPEDSVWIDLVVSRGDPLWHDDVAKSMWWVGEAWCAALTALDICGLSIHRGSLVTSPWSRLICFDGLGPGEVCRDGAKLVGISQRRTRDLARFQCVLYRAYDPSVMLSVLRDPRPEVDALRPVATIDASASAVVDSLSGALAAC